MPSELIRAFDEAAATYDAVGVEFFTPMGAELVRRAAIRPGEHVLDVGCGGLHLTTTIRITVAGSPALTAASGGRPAGGG